MNAATRLVMALSLSAAFFSVTAGATTWQEQLSSAASALGQQHAAEGATDSSGTPAPTGTSLTALAGLLSGGTQSLSAGTMTNAAGVLQYCIKNNLVDNNISSMKDQLLEKLGLQDPKQQQSIDYQQGLAGLLNTGNSQQVNLKALGETPIGKKVKTKACDLVLQQGWKFIS